MIQKAASLVKFLYLSFFLFPALLFPHLKFQEIKPVIEELLDHHIEHKNFTETCAKRSLALLAYRFDPDMIYLLEGETNDFFNPPPARLKKIVADYHKGAFTEYQALSKVMQNAIHRSRKMRSLIKTILIEEKKGVERPPFLKKSTFPIGEEELYHKTENLMRSWLALYTAEKGGGELSREERFKVINYYEKKRREHEENFLLHFNKKKNGSPLQIAKAIASSLDAHTMYYSPSEAEEMRNLLQKEFCGVGIALREGVDGPLVTGVVPGSPAALSESIAVGDILKEIDGVDVETLYFHEILKHLSGKENSSVTLSFLKGEEKRVSVVLKRQKMTLDRDRIQVSYEPFADGVIGVITLSAFYDNNEGVAVEKDVREALKDLRSHGPLYGLILDLRKNSGGFLHQAVKVASLFMQSGLVVIAKYAQDEVRYTKAGSPLECYTGPLVILTSKASASAAEIVAQTLKDQGIAVIVGDKRTYGKGSMQYQTLTDPKAKSFYKVTVGKYFTASGNSPQIYGVEADIPIPTPFTPLQIGEKYLPFPLKHETLEIKAPLQEEVKRLVTFTQTRPRTKWEKMIPTLQKNSEMRRAEDKDVQAFIEYNERRSEGNYPPRPLFGSQDLQVKEGIAIIKDMIFLAS